MNYDEDEGDDECFDVKLCRHHVALINHIDEF